MKITIIASQPTRRNKPTKLQGLDKKLWQQFDICDMTLSTGVQHLYIFNIVAHLIYFFLPNVWKASYAIFVDIPYWLPYSMVKFISWVVPGPSQWLFRVAIRPVFPGHVFFFRVKNSVRPDFLNLAKCPGFLINDCLSLFPINSMLL